MTDLASLARILERSTHLDDAAQQLGVGLRELRAGLIAAGLPVEFVPLRELLIRRFPPPAPVHDPLSLLSEAARRHRPGPVNAPVALSLPQQDSPYAVVFTGDWHIGETGTDHARLRRDTETIAALKGEYGDGVRVIAMGDYIGGYMRSKTPGNNDQILTPTEQREAACGALSLIRPDLVIQGDHDEWHTRQDDQHEWLHELCVAEGLNYAQWGASVAFESPSWTMRLLARHRFAGSRAANPDLPHINLHTQWGAADLVALAHVHSNPGIRTQRPKRQVDAPFLAVQSGTYKVFDSYAKKLGLGNGEYGVPVVLVNPQQALITPFQSLDDFTEAI